MIISGLRYPGGQEPPSRLLPIMGECFMSVGQCPSFCGYAYREFRKYKTSHFCEWYYVLFSICDEVNRTTILLIDIIVH